MGYLIYRIIGLKNDIEIVNRPYNRYVKDIDKFRENRFNFYDKSGIKLDEIKFISRDTASTKKGGRIYKIDSYIIYKYYEQNPNKTLLEIGKHFGVSKQTVSNHISKILKL